MSFSETIYALTGAFGWVIIALAVIALAYFIYTVLRQAEATVRNEGWGTLWQQIRTNVLTRKKRNER